MPQAQLPNTMGALSSQRHDEDDIGPRRRRTLGYQPHPGWTQSSHCGGKDFLKCTPVLLRHLSSVVFVFLMFLACALVSLAQLEGCPVFWKLQGEKKSKRMCFFNLGWGASPQDGPPCFQSRKWENNTCKNGTWSIKEGHSILLECAKDEQDVVCPASLSSLVGQREPSLPVRPFETKYESHKHGENGAPTFVCFSVV